MQQRYSRPSSNLQVDSGCQQCIAIGQPCKQVLDGRTLCQPSGVGGCPLGSQSCS
jgi:hypothetical protein